MNKHAVLSPCGTYRYLLERSWDPLADSVCFVMLNPSTADAEKDDPTIRKCIGFAKAWGYGSLSVVNLFACRSTDPAKIRNFTDPEGPGNDGVIAQAAGEADLVVCAWGTKSPMEYRAPWVMNLLKKIDVSAKALKITKDGHPGHPLYIPYGTPLKNFGQPV